MGNVVHHYMSIYSFVMGVMWFSTFIFLGFLMRKMKFPIRFSVFPLFLLLVLSVLRMFVAIDMPGAVVIFSDTVYPAIVSFLRHEVASVGMLGLSLSINLVNTFVFIWVVVAVWLTARYLYDYIIKFHPIMTWLEHSKRDEYAEAMLADAIGYDKQFCIFRIKSIDTAMATAFRPYILLPEIDFPPDELRPILLHEWKHIRDKDYLTSIVVELICCVFWWNPLVYILRRNFRFAQEVKCDHYAVSSKNDLLNYLKGLLLLSASKDDDNDNYADDDNDVDDNDMDGMSNAVLGDDDGLPDRIGVMFMRVESRSKRILMNIFYSFAIVMLFIVSYMFIVLPAFWESPYVIDPACEFGEEYSEGGGIFRSEEPFLVDNGDGTFSLYLEGQFVMDVDGTHESLDWIPIRAREGN